MKKTQKILYTILGMGMMVAGTAYALPYFTATQTLVPFSNNAYDLGTSTAKYRSLYLVGSDGCLTLTSGLVGSTGSACGSGSGSGGGLGTTTPWTVGNLVMVSSNANVTSISTSTLVNWILPFTSYGASTSTILGFTNGLFSLSSTTINGLKLTDLTQGFLYVGSSGKVNTVATSSLALPNTALQNSTISGVALGSNLNSFSVSADFTGTSYNGSAAVSDWVIKMSQPHSWTGLQQFANASSTLFSNYTRAYFGGTATTTIDSTGNIVIPSGSNLTVTGKTDGCATFATGVLNSTGSACGSGSGTSAFEIATSSTLASPGFATIDKVSGRTTIGSISTSTVAGYIFPFTSYGAASSTIFGFTGGLFSTASSTFSSALRLTSLSQGVAYVGSTGLVNTTATTTCPTFSTGLTYSGTAAFCLGGANGNVTVNTSQNIATLSNLTSNGYVKTSGGVGTLGVQAVPIPVSDGGTNKTSYPSNSIITSDSAGTSLIATTSDLTVSSLLATSTIKNNIFLGVSFLIGTSTDSYFQATIASSTVPQLALSAGAGNPYWTFRNAGGNFYLASTSVAGTATSSTASLTVLNSNGFVGIKNNTPANALDVDGTVQAKNALFKGPNAQVNIINTNDSATNAGFFGLTYDSLQFGYIDNNSLLYVGKGFAGSGTNAYIGTSHTVAVVSYADLTTVLDNGYGLMSVGTSTGLKYPLTVASSTAPQLSLSAGAGLAQWVFRNAGGELEIASTTVAGNATTSTAALTLKNSGYGWSASTSTPSASFAWNTVAGTDVFAIGSSTGEYLRIDATGQWYAPKLNTSTSGNALCYLSGVKMVIAGNTTCATSSFWLKKDITDIDSATAEKIIDNLRPISYTNKENHEQRYGFIAEEVAKIDPLLAEYAQEDITIGGHNFKKGDPISVDYLRAWAVLVKYVQDLKVGKVARSAEENWQWFAMAIMLMWIIRLEIKTRK